MRLEIKSIRHYFNMCTIEASDEFIMLTPEQTTHKLPTPLPKLKEQTTVVRMIKKIQRQISPKSSKKRCRKSSFQSVDFWEEDWSSMIDA